MIKKNIYLRTAFLFGLIGTLLVLTYFFTLYALGNNPLPEMNRLDILIILATTIFAMGYFRDRKRGGVLYFWEAVVLGLPVILVTTLLSSIAIYIFIHAVPEVFTDYIQAMANMIETDFKAGRFKDKSYYDTLLKGLPTITPFGRVFDIFIKNFFVCFFATGILAMIMRKHPRPQ